MKQYLILFLFVLVSLVSSAQTFEGFIVYRSAAFPDSDSCTLLIAKPQFDTMFFKGNRVIYRNRFLPPVNMNSYAVFDYSSNKTFHVYYKNERSYLLIESDTMFKLHVDEFIRKSPLIRKDSADNQVTYIRESTKGELSCIVKDTLSIPFHPDWTVFPGLPTYFESFYPGILCLYSSTLVSIQEKKLTDKQFYPEIIPMDEVFYDMDYSEFLLYMIKQ